jgi:hypothetical protein
MPETMRVPRTANLFPGRVMARLKYLEDDEIKPFLDDMAARKITQAEFDDFVTAKYAPDRNARIAQINPQMPDGGSGLTNAEARQILDGFDRAGKTSDLEALAQAAYDLRDETRQILHAGGIISDEERDSWAEHEFYVPLRGFEVDPDEDARLPAGRRYDTRAKVSQQALGRQSRSDSPLAYLIAQRQQALVLSEKARVGRTIYRQARQFPNPALWEINQVVTKRYIDPQTGLVTHRRDGSQRTRADNVLAVRIGGNLYWITIHQPGLRLVLKIVDADQLRAVLKPFAAFNRYLGKMATSLNPLFVFPNFIRDLGTGSIRITSEQGAKMTGKVLRDLPKALAGAYLAERGNYNSQWAQHAREWKLAGGSVGMYGLDTIASVKRRIDANLRATDGFSPMKAARAVKEWVEAVNGAIEAGIRLSLFVNMRRAGFSVDQSAFASKEVTTNFTRRGSWSGPINSLWLFFNARVQGTVQIAKLIAGNKYAQRTAMGMVVAGLLMDIVNSMVSGDSDDDGESDYDTLLKTKDYVAQRSLILMWPGSENGQGMTLPMPFVWNVFPYLGQQMGRVMRGKITPLEASANIAGALLQAANPWQITSDTGPIGALPTAAQPFFQLSYNTDWKGDPIMPDKEQFGKEKPDAERYFRTVSPLSRAITDFLAHHTGGDKVRPGIIDWSPETLDFIVDFLGAGVGKLVSDTANTLARAATGEDIEPSKVPLVRQFYFQHEGYVGTQQYYDMRKAVTLTYDELKQAVEDGNHDLAARIRKDYAADLRMVPFFFGKDNIDEGITTLRKARDATNDPVRKDEMTKRLDDLMAKVRKRYMDLREKQAQ